jgi:hypothetical protein
MMLTGKTEELGDNHVPVSLCPTWTEPGGKQGCFGERPVTNCLSHVVNCIHLYLHGLWLKHSPRRLFSYTASETEFDIHIAQYLAQARTFVTLVQLLNQVKSNFKLHVA